MKLNVDIAAHDVNKSKMATLVNIKEESWLVSWDCIVPLESQNTGST